MTIPDQQSQAFRFVPFFFLLAALEAVGNAVYLMALAADPKNQLVFGYSLPRLMIILGLLLLFVIGLALAAFSWRRPDRVNGFAAQLAHNRLSFQTLLIISGVIFVAGWAAVFTPDVYFGSYSSYAARLRPALVWLTLFSLQTAVYLLLWDRRLHSLQKPEMITQNKRTFLLSGIVLAGCLGIWAVVAFSRVGLRPDLFWGKTGVPLLNQQILAALLISLLLLAILHRLQVHSSTGWLRFLSGWKLDLLICVLLWLAAALLWNHQPLPHSHFAPGPYPPNNVVYPYSDAAIYDLAAQFAIIGQGFSGFNSYIDKPLYSAFLVLLHTLMGQSYQQVIALQVVFLGALPALLYLIGRQLFSRAAGVLVGVLAVFKGINSISGTLVIWDVSNPKLMMSEYPLGLALVLFTLLMVLWLKDPERRYRYLMAAGGVIGLATLIRHNTWILLAAAWLVILLVFWRKWKKWLRASFLFTILLVVSILPWMWQSGQVSHNAFYFLTPLRGVVLNNRYLPYLPRPVINLLSPPKKSLPAAAVPTLPAAGTPAAGAAAQPSSLAPSTGGRSQTFMGSLNGIISPIADNFMHDLVTSTLTLPSTFFNQDIQNLVRQQQPSSFWNTIWDGRMSPLQGILIALDLILLAIGIGASWSRWKLAGLMPLITFLAYSLGTAVARTSGGRYIVPVDWVVYFYYGFGLLQLLLWAAAFFGRALEPAQVEVQAEAQANPAQSYFGLFAWRSLAVLLGFFAIGVLVPLPQYSFPRLYPTLSRSAVVQMLADRGALAMTGYSLTDLQQFAGGGKNNVVAYGRALYPRYLDFNNDSKASEVNSGLPKSSPYLTFDLVGPGGLLSSALPMKTPPAYFPDSSEVVLVGCKTGSSVNPFAVVILNPPLTVYTQNLPLPAVCPKK
ncbi:MAG: glycosyltransferase family 39 protein [Anaerolineaceae bacterium]|nr:glycosyltransferase family 39 protein [Anaerolineaceae bacterium]